MTLGQYWHEMIVKRVYTRPDSKAFFVPHTPLTGPGLTIVTRHYVRSTKTNEQTHTSCVLWRATAFGSPAQELTELAANLGSASLATP